MRLRKRAKKELDSGLQGLKRWWCKKHKLPSNDPRFTAMTVGELLLEFYGDMWRRQEELEEELKYAGIEEQGDLHEALLKVNEILGVVEGGKVITGDPLADYWEEQIDRGEEPDLDMTLDDLKKLRGW
jgi:hypothetical protein